MSYFLMSKNELLDEKKALESKLLEFKAADFNLNMARGKPSVEQLNLSMGMLDVMTSHSDLITALGTDCRNYGIAEGLYVMKVFFAELLGVDPDDIICGGNSSLNKMFDVISCAMTHGFDGSEPWGKQGNIKFLCPVPGYDRHFSVCEYFGIEMINIPNTPTGPQMDIVEQLVSKDPSIKGIWCVPKYSNPEGITYSDETVRRFAALKPAAPDFKIFWDNAYIVHELTDNPDKLLSIHEACKECGSEDLVLEFCSTSKITFPGSGVAAVTGSKKSLKNYRKYISCQTIGPDKINQLRHLRYFGTVEELKEHMRKHKEVLAPRFKIVLDALNNEFSNENICAWNEPKGGYFVSVNVLEGTAKRVVQLCKESGVVLTDAGATYPYKNDPNDSNIRIAPSFPPREELRVAMKVFCVAVKLAAVEKLLETVEE